MTFAAAHTKASSALGFSRRKKKSPAPCAAPVTLGWPQRWPAMTYIFIATAITGLLALGSFGLLSFRHRNLGVVQRGNSQPIRQRRPTLQCARPGAPSLP